MATNTLPKTCRALRQNVYAQEPVVEEIPTPQPVPGAAVVKIELAPVISYMKRIYVLLQSDVLTDSNDGTRKYPYPTPLTLGNAAMGHIAALPADSTALEVGQLVLVDCLVRSRDKPSDVFLVGIHDGYTDGSRKLMREVWRDGTFAEYAVVPLENCFALDEARLLGSKTSGGLGYQMEDVMAMFTMLVPWGGLRDVDVRPGETVIIAPATGGFGSAAVKVALAMGAGRVIAMGRREEVLQRLVDESDGRVVTVKLTGNYDEELQGLRHACGKKGEADVFFDISPPAAWESSHLKAAICSLRHNGRASLMGGQREDVKIPYVRVMHWNLQLRGKWMYERRDVSELIQMVEAGILKLGDGGNMKTQGVFGIDEWSKASDLAEKTVGTGAVFLKP